jgi:RNA polymerase sigma-70 factor, ECF subfamily
VPTLLYSYAGTPLFRMGHAFRKSDSLPSCMTGEVEQLNGLMGRYGSGDDSAFEPLYRLLAPRLYRFCLRLAPHRTDADDLLQDTFLRLHRGRATYLAGANALHWAFAIARSASLDRLRYWQRRPESLGVANDIAEANELPAQDAYRPDFELIARDLHEVVKSALGKMSEKNRIAYVLLREEGLSVKEAALVLGSNGDVVKQRAHRAYEQLRAAISAAGWKEYEHDRPSSATRPIRA